MARCGIASRKFPLMTPRVQSRLIAVAQHKVFERHCAKYGGRLNTVMTGSSSLGVGQQGSTPQLCASHQIVNQLSETARKGSPGRNLGCGWFSGRNTMYRINIAFTKRFAVAASRENWCRLCAVTAANASPKSNGALCRVGLRLQVVDEEAGHPIESQRKHVSMIR